MDDCFAKAGRSGTGETMVEITPEGWDTLQAVDTRGVAPTYKHVTCHMIARAKTGDGGGKLIATSSDQSIMGVNKSADYAASKALLNALTRAAGFELARHRITANALLFGLYEIELTAAADPRFGEWIAGRVPLRRMCDLEGLEASQCFLPHSAHITGRCLPVDGRLCISQR